MTTCQTCHEPIRRDWTPTDPSLAGYHAGCRPGAGRLPRAFTTPADLPYDARLTLQYRVRHPSRKTTREYWTLNARVTEASGRTATLGDFGRWYVTGDHSDFLAAKAAAAAALQTARLDLLTRRHTAFTTFAELLDAPYQPTLRGAAEKLGRAYDAAQLERGTGKRSFR